MSINSRDDQTTFSRLDKSFFANSSLRKENKPYLFLVAHTFIRADIALLLYVHIKLASSFVEEKEEVKRPPSKQEKKIWFIEEMGKPTRSMCHTHVWALQVRVDPTNWSEARKIGTKKRGQKLHFDRLWWVNGSLFSLSFTFLNEKAALNEKILFWAIDPGWVWSYGRTWHAFFHTSLDRPRYEIHSTRLINRRQIFYPQINIVWRKWKRFFSRCN